MMRKETKGCANPSKWLEWYIFVVSSKIPCLARLNYVPEKYFGSPCHWLTCWEVCSFSQPNLFVQNGLLIESPSWVAEAKNAQIVEEIIGSVFCGWGFCIFLCMMDLLWWSDVGMVGYFLTLQCFRKVFPTKLQAAEGKLSRPLLQATTFVWIFCTILLEKSSLYVVGLVQWKRNFSVSTTYI